MACSIPAGFTIIRGDDSDAFGRTIQFELETDLDLVGCSAVFQIAELKWIFEDITSKVLDIVVTKEQSLKLNEGVENGALKIFDADGKTLTVISDMPIYIESQVVDNER